MGLQASPAVKYPTSYVGYYRFPGGPVNASRRRGSAPPGAPAAIVQEYLAAFPPEGHEPEVNKLPGGEPLSVHRRGARGASDDHRAESQVDLVHQMVTEEGRMGLSSPLQEQLPDPHRAEPSHQQGKGDLIPTQAPGPPRARAGKGPGMEGPSAS